MNDLLEVARRVSWRTGFAVGATVAALLFGGLFLLQVHLTGESRATNYQLIDKLNETTASLQGMIVAYRRCQGIEPVCEAEMLEWAACRR